MDIKSYILGYVKGKAQGGGGTSDGSLDEELLGASALVHE